MNCLVGKKIAKENDFDVNNNGKMNEKQSYLEYYR